jgi:hypothetical protein
MTQQFDVQGTLLLCFLVNLAIRRRVRRHNVMIYITVIYKRRLTQMWLLPTYRDYKDASHHTDCLKQQSVTPTQKATSVFRHFFIQPSPRPRNEVSHIPFQW